MPYGSNLFSLLYFVGGFAKLNVSTHLKGGCMISNRRQLLTAAAVAAVLSTHATRAAETVIEAILEEVSRDQLRRFADEYRNDWKQDRDGTYEYRGRRYDEKEWEAYWRKRYREEKRNNRKDRDDREGRRDRGWDDRNDWNDDVRRRDDAVRRLDEARARREREEEKRRQREDERRRRADEERVRRMDEEVRRRDEEIRRRDALQRLTDAAQR